MPGLASITTPAATSQLTTLAVAKDELGITVTTYDAAIGRIIDRASSAIVNYTGLTFGAETITETFRFGATPGVAPAYTTVAPYGTPLDVQYRPLLVTKTPIVAVTSVTENGTVLVLDTDFEMDKEAGVLYRLRNSRRGWWNPPTIVAVYSAGWNLPNDANRTLPSDVEDACLALVRSAWFARGRDPAVQMDTLDRDRTQFWERSVSPMAIDDGLAAQLGPYVVRVW